MGEKITDLLEPFQDDLKSLVEDILQKPFIVSKDSCNFGVGKNEQSDFQYENCSERYILHDSDMTNFYCRQYFHYYRMRAAHLYPRIEENARDILGATVKHVPLTEVKSNQKTFIIGCLLKRMKNRAAVLKDLEDETDEQVEIRLHKEDDLETLAADSDFLELEDIQKQTISLKGAINPYDFVTGMVIGVYGTQAADNFFDVEKVILPSLPAYVERPLLDKDVYVVFASGFNIDDPCSSTLRKLNYFGELFCSPKYYNNIARIIFAGNNSLIFCQCENCLRTSINNVMPIGLTLDFDKNESALIASNNFRRNFANLNIDVMPGENDPTSSMLPQQPMNKVLLEDYDLPIDDEEIEKGKAAHEKFDTNIETFTVPTTSQIDSSASDYWLAKSSGLNPGMKRDLNPVTNPYSFKIMGVSFHGTSGQNVNSFRRLTSKRKSTLKIMRDFIETGLIAPTAPDFMDCFPYDRKDGRDPLALDEMPHVFFAGNQKEFATEMAEFGDGGGQKVRLISIPKFDQTHSMVVVNLRTLEVSRIVSK